MRAAAALWLALALAGCGSSNPDPISCRIWGESKPGDPSFRASAENPATGCFTTGRRVADRTTFHANFGQYDGRTLLLEISMAARPGPGSRTDVPTTVSFKEGAAFAWGDWRGECTSTLSLLEDAEEDRVNVRGDVTCPTPLTSALSTFDATLAFDGPLHFEGPAD